ncbi:hypothetical protein ACB094_05G208600 [Castanea mollissima]
MALKVGPWGAQSGGTIWSFVAKGEINEIEIVNGYVIDSISFKYKDECGVLQTLNVGGTGGQKTNKISLKWPEEYLTSFDGRINDFMGHAVIFSITFKTNKATYGPYGTVDGKPFRHNGGVIVGFHGYAGEFVDAIGAYATLPYVNTTLKEPDHTTKMAVPRGPGPWGGHGGMEWDHGIFLAIRELQLHVGDSVIHAIRVLYESKDGEPVWSPKHGGDGCDQIKTIKLEVSEEFLVRIAGFYGPVKGCDSFKALRSITFYTNKAKYGPYGDEVGDAFTSSVTGGKVVGFHGRSGVYLDAIGVHMEYF